MNVSLLKYMNAGVELTNDPSHVLGKVVGLNWVTEKLLVFWDTGRNTWVHHDDIIITKEFYDEADNPQRDRD